MTSAFRPLDSTARDGRSLIVRRGSQYARAYWTGGMWAYDFGIPSGVVEKIDFEPTHYAELRRAA